MASVKVGGWGGCLYYIYTLAYFISIIIMGMSIQSVPDLNLQLCLGFSYDGLLVS